MQKPQNFDNTEPKNAVTQHEAAFMALCVGLSQNGVNDPGSLPVYELYKYLEHFEKKAEKNQVTD